MTLKATHPKYDDQLPAWTITCDCNEGELRIKKQGPEYLPVTSGQMAAGYKDGGPGLDAYKAYKARAVFPDYYADAVVKAVGDMHRTPPHFDLPASMEVLRNHCTLNGDSLAGFLRSINVHQIATGRVGVLGDITDGTKPTPYLSLYGAKAIRNWHAPSEQIAMVILDESGYEMQADFQWKHNERYRVLALGNMVDGRVQLAATGGYHTATGSPGDNPDTLDWIAPHHTGRQLDAIPFQFINTVDLDPNPDNPPLLGLAHDCLKIYRGEADYRLTLFRQGQDTFVTIGGDIDPGKVLLTGAEARLDLPEGAKAEYVGIGAEGLAEQRAALENDRAAASGKAGIPNTQSNQKESGEALRRRQSSQTVSLTQIAQSGAEGLTRVLRNMAPWFNANPDEINVEPNLDFNDNVLDGRSMVDIMTAKGLGLPVSLESIHQYAADQGLTKKTFEDEMGVIGTEDGL